MKYDHLLAVIGHMNNKTKGIQFLPWSALVILGLAIILPLPTMGQTVAPSESSRASPRFRRQQESPEVQKLLQKSLDLAQAGQWEDALTYAQQATQLDPKSAIAWGTVGSVHLNLDQVDRSLKALERSRQLFAKNPGVLFSLGAAYFEKDNFSKAKDALREGLKLKPRDVGAILNLGNTYYKLGQQDVALAQYRRAIAIDKTFWPAINNSGLIQYESGEITTAMQSWRAAQDLDKTAAEPKLALGVALYQQGEQDKGLKLATEALALDPQLRSLEFLRDNLWGQRLLEDTQKIFANPRLKP